MSSADILDHLRALPSAERREVISKIWEEFADSDLELTAEQAAELDRRAANHAAHPRDVVPWESIKAATKAKHGGHP